MAENTDDLKEIFGADAAGLPQKDWEKRLKENEKTAASFPASDAPAPAPIVQEQANKPKTPKNRGNFWFFVLLLAFCVSAVCGVYLTVKPGMSCPDEIVTDKPVLSLNSSAKDNSGAGIAWIKIRGVIAESDNQSPWARPSSASYISKSVREAAKDKNVKAIVLDINSPGGTVASVQDIYSEILSAKEQGKKVVALFRDVAASGAFYIAMAADKIVAEPGTITGSVGVIMQAGNVVGLFDKLGIQVTPITSGKYKDMGSAYRPMTEAEKALLQDMVNDTYSQFFAVVKAGRPNVTPEDLAEYTDGRVFTGQRAFNLGFIDKLGGEETARLLAGELAGLKDPKILTRKKEGLRELIFSFGSGMESKNLSKQLQSVSTPRVSYLWAY